MTEEEIRAYLREGHPMTLATNGPNGHPHAVAMFYALWISIIGAWRLRAAT